MSLHWKAIQWSGIIMLVSVASSLVAGWHALAVGLLMTFATLAFLYGTAWLGDTKRHLHESAEHESDDEAREADLRERNA
jgi:hypothetical protein